MSKLYVVALVLRRESPGATTLKPTLSWRMAASEDEAVGGALKWAREELPEWAIASHIATEIPPDQLAGAVKYQNDRAAMSAGDAKGASDDHG